MDVAGRRFCSQVLKIAAQNAGTAFPFHNGGASFSTSVSAHQLRRRTELSFEELSDLITFDDAVALVDVRSQQELNTYGSIPGAINIPLGEVKTALQLSEAEFLTTFLLPKPTLDGRSLVFFARGPNASSAAVEIAHKLGFKSSRQYTGGWEDYCKMTGVPLKKLETSASKPANNPSRYMSPSGMDFYKSFSV